MRRVFFGCNYNDTAIKAQFDALKTNLENRYPIDCVIVDKRRNKAAQDIWDDIKNELWTCSTAFFDVSAFRPNVVLELGYGLATLDTEERDCQVFITWRRRKSKKTLPQWLLSDISHLQRHEYTRVTQLAAFVETQLLNTPWLQRFDAYNDLCTTETAAAAKYQVEGLKVLLKLRDDGPQTAAQVTRLIKGSAVRRESLTEMLKKAKLVKRTQGANSKFYLRDD